MQGRIFLIATLLLAGCSGNSIMRPDCHSCTADEQAWKDFSWTELSGAWRGSVETVLNERGAAKKNKTEKGVEFRFFTAENFLRAKKSTCEKLPTNALVLNGRLWEEGRAKTRTEYETFLPLDGDKVAYGRLSFEKMNGQEICQFRRLGRVMGTNRLALPTVSFSELSTQHGRALAAESAESEVNLEFLRFAPSKPVVFTNGRGPAAERERPPLMIRVFKVSSRNTGDRGEWRGSEEQIYRLWKAK